MLKKRKARNMLNELKEISRLIESSNEVASLFEKSRTIQREIEYGYLSKQEQYEFRKTDAEIVKKVSVSILRSSDHMLQP